MWNLKPERDGILSVNKTPWEKLNLARKWKEYEIDIPFQEGVDTMIRG